MAREDESGWVGRDVGLDSSLVEVEVVSGLESFTDARLGVSHGFDGGVVSWEMDPRGLEDGEEEDEAGSSAATRVSGLGDSFFLTESLFGEGDGSWVVSKESFTWLVVSFTDERLGVSQGLEGGVS